MTITDPTIAVLLVLGIMVIGEIISILTRARVPMLLVAMLGYMLLIWTGVFPKDILETSTLTIFGSLMVAPLIIHLGTIIPFKVLKGQGKTILIALTGMLAATLLLLAIAAPIFGYETAVSAAGPIVGGTIAFLITTEKLTEIGMSHLVAIPALIVAIQGLIGMPIATFFLRKFANSVKGKIKEAGYAEVAAAAEIHGTADTKSWIPKKYQTNMVLVFQLFFGGALALFLGNVTGINFSIWALAIGFIGAYFGFYQQNMLERSNSFGIAMVGLIFFILVPMNNVTPSMFAKSLLIVLAVMAIGIIGLIGGGYITSKFFKWDPNKGIAVALTALLGFPADYILCEEVSRSVGETEEERKAIFNEIVTPMLIGGFTTVTTASIVIASILMNTL
ncbi:hypothetical protein SAMN05877753_101134 [Bacillus oleivorans]|uniref:Na+/glutamate symporter n=1 Tax=Bacillus oleivorans TaxID=1448271 RepID=A0A285CGU4_9BACI|nr:hypothetical protein [Bacillus oleivorans]SNX66822.1 hypothetical protein SAMN05877753_101134 [Bacillus oleivorans]